ncbi:hypothetical protein [Dongia sp. agr-C8]
MKDDSRELLNFEHLPGWQIVALRRAGSFAASRELEPSMRLPLPQFDGPPAIEKNTGIRVTIMGSQDLESVRILFEVPAVLPKVDYSDGMSGTFYSGPAGRISSLSVYGFRYYFQKFLRTVGYDEDDIRQYLLAGLTHAGYLSSWRDVHIHFDE